jgi:gluconate 2-dehydrogenase gamma chain
MTRSSASSPGNGLSRRAFFTGSLVGGASVVAACTASDVIVPPEQDVEAPDREPLPPDQAPVAGVYQFFTQDEARTVDAVVARIIPGTAEDPGAREAGVITYIDAKLAEFEAFAEPTYLQPPYAEGYEGRLPPASDDVVAVPQDQLYRYGYQSGSPPQDTYRDGLPGLDRYCEQRFGAAFADLSETDQDAVLQILDAVQQRSEGELREGGGSPGGGQSSAPPMAELDAAEAAFGEVDPGGFFTTVRGDTIEGMFADPVYGGNRGLAGWTLIGYPGPQRSYSPQEMTSGTRRLAQSLDGLPPMNPGRPHHHGIDPMQKPRSGVRGG